MAASTRTTSTLAPSGTGHDLRLSSLTDRDGEDSGTVDHASIQAARP